MNEFIKILLSLSISGTLLLLLILGLKHLYKNKFSRRWQYYIWIIAALRYLLPFTPDTTIVGNLFKHFETYAAVRESTINPSAPVSVTTDNQKNRQTEKAHINSSVSVPAITDNQKNSPDNNNSTITAAVHNLSGIYIGLFFVWAAPALILFVRKITLYKSFIQYINAGNTAVSDIKTLNLLSDWKEKLHIKGRIELSRNVLTVSPMMIGFFRPCIVLPVRELEENDLSYVFMHELTHYKQRDMFYKWLLQIVVCIHWFNPFVYLLEREINKSCELSCDETVISLLDAKARREYGDMLISFVKIKNLHKNALASVTLTEGAEQLKERLDAIMKFKTKSMTVRAVTTICTAAVCVCFWTSGAYAAPSAAKTYMTWKDIQLPNDRYAAIGAFHKKAFAPDTAQTIETNNRYTYVQRSYYSDSYIITMGWNMTDTMGRDSADSRELTLEDNSTITVYFGNMPFGDLAGNAINYMDDSNAVSAIGKLIYSMKNSMPPSYPALETPLVTDIAYVDETDLPALAEEYVENGNVTEFTAIFSLFDTDLQMEYCQKLYDKDNTAFFAAVLPYMDRDSRILFARKADQDNKMNFFFLLIPHIQPEDINKLAEKFYQDNNLSRFTVIAPYMTENQREAWLIRARTDKKTAFSVVLYPSPMK